MTANRRFSSGLLFGISYTYSKTMDLTSNEWGGLPTYVDRRTWNYGPANFDQTHMWVANYLWRIPKLSSKWNNVAVRAVFDNWTFSGTTTFASGAPNAVSYSTTDNADITGGGDGGRALQVAGPNLSHGDRSFSRWFNTDAFARPPQGDRGTAPTNSIRGPGINNWDMTFAKDIPLGSEARFLEFRADFYNAFNHTQFSAIDTAARFDPAGNQVNGRFGQVIATRPARIIQFALRFTF